MEEGAAGEDFELSLPGAATQAFKGYVHVCGTCRTWRAWQNGGKERLLLVCSCLGRGCCPRRREASVAPRGHPAGPASWPSSLGARGGWAFGRLAGSGGCPLGKTGMACAGPGRSRPPTLPLAAPHGRCSSDASGVAAAGGGRGWWEWTPSTQDCGRPGQGFVNH